MAPFVLLALAAAPAQQTIAFPEWTAIDVKPALATFFADQVAESMREDGLVVITSAEIVSLLGQQRQAQLTGCTEGSESCLAELSQALGAELTLVGSVARLDESFEVRLKVVRANSAKVIAETTVSAKGQTALLPELSAAGHRLAQQLHPGAPKASSSKALAWLTAGAGVVVAGIGGGLLVAANSQYDSLSRYLAANAVNSAAREMASTGKGLQTGGWVCVGAGAAALVAGVVLLLLPSSPAAPVVSLGPNGVSFGFAGAF